MTQTYMQLGDKVLRPKFKSENIPSDYKSFKRLVDNYVSWCDDTQYLAADREDYERDIRSCFDQFDFDGYNLAEHLKDTCYVSPDADLVDLLDDVFYIRNSFIQNLYETWVNENQLVIPENVIGKRVNVKQGYQRYDNHFITTVKPKTYQVTVDLKNDRPGGYVVNFENVTFID